MGIKKKQTWNKGDVVLIPQKDDFFSFAYVLDHVMENVVGLALYLSRTKSDDPEEIPSISKLQPVSILLTTRDLLDEGVWKVIGREEVRIPNDIRPYEIYRDLEWVGAKVYGAGIVRQFLDACFGLDPWDDWKDPAYLDKLLLDKASRPPDLIFKN
ncbi:MAG: hypothetical protein HRU15_13405 [Planctomycetes bacterium]|nr:hypothetical protein [Planctomycetota bacterium]